MPAGCEPGSASVLRSTSPRFWAAGAPPLPSTFPLPATSSTATTSSWRSSGSTPRGIRGYAVVNPNFQRHALSELARCLDAGMVGIKLAASRRADDPLLDPICRVAGERGVPVLHHIWQHRRRDYPGQEASDAVELGALAARHPGVNFLLAHIGGGGDWIHSLAAIRSLPNVYVDLSGSGVDGGMLEACVQAVGVERLVWGCDLTIDTGWAKLRYLEHLLSRDQLELIRWRNAARDLSPQRVSHRLMRLDVNSFVGAYPFRRVPGTSVEAVLAIHGPDRRGSGVDQPPASVFWRDPAEGNAWLYQITERQRAAAPGSGDASRARGLGASHSRGPVPRCAGGEM